MEELQEALKKIQQLDRDTTGHDIEDTLKAIGSFLYRDLDDVKYAIENAIEVMKGSEEYISDIEAELAELKAITVSE